MTAPVDPSQELRRTIRAYRRALSDAEREAAAASASRHAAGLDAFREASAVAAYLAVDGELDPAPLLDEARRLGKTVYLPVLQGDGAMRFAPYTPESEMIPNRFGILEPRADWRTLLHAEDLDLVLTPLVAFDAHGGRLGMGGGFYDRTFAFLHTHPRPRPQLIGFAYELQRTGRLALASWDVPLHAVVTEQRVYHADGR